MLEWLHPMRISRFTFGSSVQPMMRVVASVANSIREDRHAVAGTAPLKMLEHIAFDAVRDALIQFRTGRDKKAITSSTAAHTTVVQIGHWNARSAEVLSGLSQGGEIVLHPSDRVMDGVRVSQRRGD